MRKRISIRLLTHIFLLIALVFLQISPVALAHPNSQEGILAKTYIENYGDYYIGGDNVGWSIDENNHTDGNILTYSFSNLDPYLNNDLKAHVINGAAMWSDAVTIINKTDGTGTGHISTYYNANTYTVAKFCDFLSNDLGHLIYWNIDMNRAYAQSDVILAHELGHAIGLNDLYANSSNGKLMYGYTGGSANGPTSSDIWGAKVITGSHLTHAWGYKYWDTNMKGNVHIQYCITCNGLGVYTAQCTYQSGNRCTICGTNKHTPIIIG